MSAPARTDATYAEAQCGMWIARCGRPYCTNALAVARGMTLFHCEGPMSCGWTGELVWPADPDAIETILSMRPVPVTRNWLPGETLAALVQENVAHGIMPDEWVALAEAAPGGSLSVLDIVDEVAVGGLLYPQIEAARRTHQIGA